MIRTIFYGVLYAFLFIICIVDTYGQEKIIITNVRVKGRLIICDIENTGTTPLSIPNALVSYDRRHRIIPRIFWFSGDTLTIQVQGGDIKVTCIRDRSEIERMVIVDGCYTLLRYMVLLPGRRYTLCVRDWRGERGNIKVVKIIFMEGIVALNEREYIKRKLP